MVAQRPETKLVDITFDVSSTEPNALTVSLQISKDAMQIGVANAFGDMGAGVSTGTGKTILWDAGADWGGNVENLTFALVANDGTSHSDVTAVCPVPKTGQTVSLQAGDDGDLDVGQSWPSPRFSELSSTVLDNLTGLEWAKAPHSISGNASYMVWADAVDFCNALELSGHDDWRLPSAREMLSLVDYGQFAPALPVGHPFTGIQTWTDYWTSTTLSYHSGVAVPVDINDGRVSIGGLSKSHARYVWPVRRVASCVARTGQTASYGAGDDGDLEKGEEWPVPRFVDRGDGTVFDKLTGMEWVQEPQSLPSSVNGDIFGWQDAVDYCSQLVFANHADWRLPNVKEQESLLHYGAGTWGDRPYEWLNSAETPFKIDADVHHWNFWSSTFCAEDTNDTWLIDMSGSQIFPAAAGSYYIWPVRTPQPDDAGLVSGTTNVVVDSRAYILNIDSMHGDPVPPVGTHSNYCWRSVVECSANAAVREDGRNYVCTGWWGSTGSGDDNQTGSITLSNSYSTLIWKWKEKSSSDSDSDGMDDVWESDYFQTLERGSDGDQDGDGQNDLHEFMFGTLPTNEGSIFAFEGHAVSAPVGYQLLFPGTTGRTYGIEYKDCLSEESWNSLTNGIPGSEEAISIKDLGLISNRFYRVQVQITD